MISPAKEDPATMGFVERILSGWMPRRIRAKAGGVAREVALRSRTAVLERVARKVSGMGRHEARGYVRARAAVVIERETNTLLGRTAGRAVPVPEDVMRLATDQVVNMVLQHFATNEHRRMRLRRAA